MPWSFPRQGRHIQPRSSLGPGGVKPAFLNAVLIIEQREGIKPEAGCHRACCRPSSASARPCRNCPPSASRARTGQAAAAGATLRIVRYCARLELEDIGNVLAGHRRRELGPVAVAADAFANNGNIGILGVKQFGDSDRTLVAIGRTPTTSPAIASSRRKQAAEIRQHQKRGPRRLRQFQS